MEPGIIQEELPTVLALLAGLISFKAIIVTCLGPFFGLSKTESVRTGMLLSGKILTVYLIDLSVCLSVYLIDLSVCLSVRLFVCRSVCLFVCLICRSVCLSLCLFD